MLNRNVQVDIPCQRCGHTLPLSVKQLEDGLTYECPGCKALITLEGSQFKGALKELEDKLRKFGR